MLELELGIIIGMLAIILMDIIFDVLAVRQDTSHGKRRKRD